MTSERSPRKRVQRHRDKMRRAGFRLVQIWVPDTRSPAFAKECRRQSRIIARATEEEEAVMKWIDDTRDVEGWTG